MKKAQGAVLLAIMLIVITVIIISSLQFYLSSSIEKKSELQFDEDLYVTENALRLSKLYLETALDYSVYQAMFDAGKDGLPKNIDDLKGKLASKISENMKKYTEREFNFIGKIARLPTYDKNMLTIEKFGENDLNVSATGNGNIYFEETTTVQMEKKYIRLELSSYLERIYSFNFFGLYEKALEFSNKINECEDEKIIDGIYEISLATDQNKKPCNVKVSVKDVSQTFPVFNGREVAFEPVVFEFLVSVA